jgi:putative transposase
VRVVWNDTLAYCQELYQQGEKKPKYTELSKRLTQIKKTKEKQWLTEVSSIPLQQSLRDLETAYSNFFASCKGERKGKKVKPPKFKKRKSKRFFVTWYGSIGGHKSTKSLSGKRFN